jgi:putative ABC transport system permease protein
MFLAIRQIRRALGRYSLLTLVVAMLLLLILLLQAFRVALVTLFIGAVQNQSAPILVYDTDARRSISNSTITESQQQQIAAIPGVGSVGRLGVALVPVRRTKATDVATIIGYESTELGAPTKVVTGRLPRTTGEAVASDSQYRVGETVSIVPGGLKIRIVGVTRESYLFASGIFMSYATYQDAVRAANPTAAALSASALAVVPSAGTTPQVVIDRINALNADVEALTRDAAANRNPAVTTVTGLFNSLLPLFGAVVPLVTGLFFVIITVQQSASLSLLRAIGAPSARLLSSLLIQSVTVLGFGLGLGLVGFFAITRIGAADVQLEFNVASAGDWTIGLFALGLLSALVAARRVLSADPQRAFVGGGIGR